MGIGSTVSCRQLVLRSRARRRGSRPLLGNTTSSAPDPKRKLRPRPKLSPAMDSLPALCRICTLPTGEAKLVRRYVLIGMAALVFVAFVLVSTPQSDWAEMAFLTVAVGVLFVGLTVPSIRRVALARKRLFVGAGVATMALGIGVIPAMLAMPSAASVDLGTGISITLLLIGAMAAWLPYMSMNMNRATQAQRGLDATDRATIKEFSPVTEAVAALTDPLDRLRPFARVVGPWLVVFCALPLVVLPLNQMAKPHLDKGQAEMLLLILFGAIVVGFLVLILAAIQWTRFIVTGREPSWAAVPGGALWGWGWRLFIFGSVFRSAGGIEPWLSQHLPQALPWVLHALAEAAVFSLAVMATPFATSLTSVAVNAANRAAQTRGNIYRMTGRKLYLGAALVLAPLFVVSWLSDTFAGLLEEHVAQVAITYVYLVVLFLTVVAFAGYLARLYARAGAVAAFATGEPDGASLG